MLSTKSEKGPEEYQDKEEVQKKERADRLNDGPPKELYELALTLREETADQLDEDLPKETREFASWMT
jgi:hypothetical protein